MFARIKKFTVGFAAAALFLSAVIFPLPALAETATEAKTSAPTSVPSIQEFQVKKSKLIPECLLKNNLPDACRDVSIFVYFLIQVSRYLFGIIGALALLMFVYGGFTLILSQGSSEKVKKGGEIILAAVIGLIIMFGAYMLVSFLGEAAKIQTEFKLTK